MIERLIKMVITQCRFQLQLSTRLVNTAEQNGPQILRRWKLEDEWRQGQHHRPVQDLDHWTAQCRHRGRRRMPGPLSDLGPLPAAGQRWSRRPGE